MAITITLVHQGRNHLRYLCVSSGAGTGTITSTGAASPDLKTDTLAGVLKNLANAFENGYGKLPAGALTQAQARGLWLSDNAANIITESRRPPLATSRLTFRAQAATGPLDAGVDANVDGGGHPTLTVSAGSSAGAAWSGYLDIMVDDGIGD